METFWSGAVRLECTGSDSKDQEYSVWAVSSPFCAMGHINSLLSLEGDKKKRKVEEWERESRMCSLGPRRQCQRESLKAKKLLEPAFKKSGLRTSSPWTTKKRSRSRKKQ